MFQMPALLRFHRRLITACALIASVLLLGACGSDEKAQPWDGDWTRVVEVPKGVAGRCIDETLHIDRGYWQLKATVHATYNCSMPTLELVYEGVLGKVTITRQTPTLEANISIDTLKLVKVANISRGQYDYLGSNGVKQLADIYLGQTLQTQMPISVAGDSLATPLFQPLWAVAYSDVPYEGALKIYTRVPAKK
jgi:hypothetical protein